MQQSRLDVPSQTLCLLTLFRKVLVQVIFVCIFVFAFLQIHVLVILSNGNIMNSELDEFSVSCAIFIGSTEIVLSALICIIRDDDFQQYLVDDSFTLLHADNLFRKHHIENMNHQIDKPLNFTNIYGYISLLTMRMNSKIITKKRWQKP